MTKALNPRRDSAPYVVEFLGTYFLVLTIGLNVSVNVTREFSPIPIGWALTALVFMGGHISGAHYNPAVTLAVLLSGRGKITVPKAALYWAVQLLGGILAAATSYGLSGESFIPQVKPDHSYTQGFFCEALFTGMLALVVLEVATTKAQANNSFFGIAIGMTVMVGIFAAGPISGGVFNPAVGTGATIIDAFVTLNPDASSIWIYWIAPLLGATAAALVFRLVNVDEYEVSNEAKYARVALNDEEEK